jgi:hypothetical protein
MEPITNDMDMIDSRDIINRVKEIDDDICDGDTSCIGEMESLNSIIDQAEGCGDFESGGGLINEDYFTEYCQELCEDCGDIPEGLPRYIKNHIDWDGVARGMKQDYTEIDFDGVSYFMMA